MSPVLVGALGMVLLLALMFANVPIAVTMALTGIIGFAVISGIDASLFSAGLAPFSNTANYVFIVLPLFLIMGEFCEIAQIMKNSFRGANTMLGDLPGGLAMASIFGAALFSGVSGSSMSCCATMTRIAAPSLLDDYKYDPKLAMGALMAGGTLGNLIPPGNAFVFYAMMSETSVGQLYMASIIPGILLTVMYLLQIYIQCKINPKLAPIPYKKTSLVQKIFAIKYMWEFIFLFGLVMGGIWFGIFTATEAAAVGTVAAFIFVVARKTLNGKTLKEAFNATLRTTGMASAIIISAMIFTYFISVTRLPAILADWIVSLNFAPIVVIILMMITYSILGTAMDTLSMIFVTLPIFIPIVSALGFDLYWFGILIITQMEFSNITPPVGMNIFVVASMVKKRGISMDTIFRACLPFCFTMLVFNALLLIFPAIAIFLPQLMRR